MFNLYIPKNKYEKKYVLELLKRNFFPNLPFAQIKTEITPGKSFIFTEARKFIGSITIDSIDKTTAAFRLVAIDEPLRNQGLGNIMLGLAESIVIDNNYSLIYIRSTLIAVNFYRRAGFIETINNEFNFVPDTIFMSKELRNNINEKRTYHKP